MSLFDTKTLDFLSSRITKREAAQVNLWARQQLQTKIDLYTGFTQHLLNMVGYKALLALDFLLRNDATNEQQQSLEHTIFVQYYKVYLRIYRLLHSSVEKNDVESQQRYTQQLEKMRRKLEHRQAKRTDFLQKVFDDSKSSDMTPTIRFTAISDWFERQHQQQHDDEQQHDKDTVPADFDLVVHTFVEHMTQTLLEKSLQHLVFPNRLTQRI